MTFLGVDSCMQPSPKRCPRLIRYSNIFRDTVNVIIVLNICIMFISLLPSSFRHHYHAYWSPIQSNSSFSSLLCLILAMLIIMKNLFLLLTIKDGGPTWCTSAGLFTGEHAPHLETQHEDSHWSCCLLLSSYAWDEEEDVEKDNGDEEGYGRGR